MSEVKTDKISSVSTNGNITLDPDGTGDVVIQGASGSAADLSIKGGDDTNSARIFMGGDSNPLNGRIVYSPSSNFMALSTGGDERMRIDSSGKVGIGNSSPSHLLDATVASDSATARFGTTDNSGNNHGTVIISNGGTGDAMLRFDYEGSNTDRARLGLTASGQDLQFFTAGNNERMRINSLGDLLVACTSTDSNSSSGVRMFSHGSIHATRTNEYAAVFRRSSSDGGVVLFRRDANNVGGINVTSSSTSYVTSSDARLKENVTDLTGAIDRVKQLAPKRFNFIVDADTTVDGFLAHEAQTVVPEAVTGTHNEVDDDGNAVMQGIDQAKLVPLLTGALKEAIAKIEALEARVTALEDA